MIVIIPLGGTGQRFKEHNYSEPKALIRIFGIPILFYLLNNLQHAKDLSFIYIPYNPEYTKYNFEDMIRKHYPTLPFRFYNLEGNTRGALETVYISLSKLDDADSADQPVLCLDSDNFYTCDIIGLWNRNNQVFVFDDSENNSEIYSFVKPMSSSDSTIVDIKEKQRISDLACTGAYGFRSLKELMSNAKYLLDNMIQQKNEFYISGVIKHLIASGDIFTYQLVSKMHYNCLGTPLQVRQFINNYPGVSCINNHKKIEKLRFCFDLDNTLVTYPEVSGDYSTVKPIQSMINYLKYLKSFGHTIIIYTARRMKTCNGNVGSVIANVGKVTLDTLEKFNIPYDEFYFGKPYADFYIDDNAINAFDDIEKKTGFYNNKIETRYFNQIVSSSIDTIIKRGADLAGEIYYYNHIPVEIKDMFPIFISSHGDNTYTIERIAGTTATELYLSNLLSENTLVHIMKSIRRIQENPVSDNDVVNIYKNYAEKLHQRYTSYNYSVFNDAERTYRELYDKLVEYERNNAGRKTIIHGDPVLTNILINKYDKIKFIDMRGKVGDTLTIYGDWLYDWAKLYQSLCGYDRILQGKEVNNIYESRMLEVFKNTFIKWYSDADFEHLKVITKSLLFTLIPLHTDSYKVEQYYNLISKIN